MKKSLFYLLFMAVLLAISASTKAQEEANYVVVESYDNELAAIKFTDISRLFISDEKWVFELKDSDEKYQFYLDDVSSFKVEMRTSGFVTNIQPAGVPELNVYDDGNNIIISNPNGKIGYYSVYDVCGRLVETGHESGSMVVVATLSKGVYIVKVNEQTKKIIRK